MSLVARARPRARSSCCAILGHHATFFVELLRACPAALRRPYLVVAQIHAIGNLLAGHHRRLGPGGRLRARAADVLRARHLRRRRVARPDRQPVAGARARAGRHRAAVRRPRRHVADRRDRPDEGRRAARRDGHDGGRPEAAACWRRASSAGIISMPILAVLFSSVGILGAYVVARAADRRRRGQLLVDHAGAASTSGATSATASSRASSSASSAPSSRSTRATRREATPEGVAHATTRTVVIASLGVLVMDFVLTALMFSTP